MIFIGKSVLRMHPSNTASSILCCCGLMRQLAAFLPYFYKAVISASTML